MDIISREIGDMGLGMALAVGLIIIYSFEICDRNTMGAFQPSKPSYLKGKSPRHDP